MDAIEILGSLLGGRKPQSQSGSEGSGSILKDLINAGRRGSGASSSSSGRVGKPSLPAGPKSLEQQSRELEEMLGVARERTSQKPPPANRSPELQRPDPLPTPTNSPYQRPEPQGRPHSPEVLPPNDEALVLVRAMINAAKADGQVSPQEQQAVISRISNPSRETINFLQREFSTPLDVREFAWSIPIGMEQKVYLVSLAAIELDTAAEANYLRDLAHGLRLTPQTCNALHQQYDAPLLF